MSTAQNLTTQPRTTAPRPDGTGAGAPEGRARRYRGRAVAAGFVIGCLAGSSVAWAVTDDGAAPSGTAPTAPSRPAVVVSADAAEQRAAERRDDCRTLGTADAVARCLEAPLTPAG